MMFYALGGALLDAGIAVWDAKLHYDFVRPVSAIRHVFADEDLEGWQGPRRGLTSIRGEAWRPYQALDHITPPFPEYTSGHSGFSHAAAEALAEFTGTDRFYDGRTVIGEDVAVSDGTELLGTHRVRPGGLRFEPGPSTAVELRWDTLSAAAEESARSRIYGGIHILDGDLRARTMGREAGRLALDAARAHWDALDVARVALRETSLVAAALDPLVARLDEAGDAQRAGDTPTACGVLRGVSDALTARIDDAGGPLEADDLAQALESVEHLRSGWCPA